MTTRLGGIFVRCDVSSEEDGQAAVAAASEMGPLRALVNSAGLGRAARTVDRNNEPAPQSDFEFVIRINLLGSYNMLRLSAADWGGVLSSGESPPRGRSSSSRASRS